MTHSKQFGQRAKLQVYGNGAMLVGFGLDEQLRETVEVHCYYTTGFLIRLRRAPSPALDALRQAGSVQPQLGSDPIRALHPLISSLYTQFTALALELDERRRSVIVDATERLAIRTPRYWLAPAVVAVAAWLKDDEGLYLDSISSALNLDPGKTALFMILLLRHQERAGAMREWIGRYLAGLEPTNLPTDFAVILEAVSGGTLAPGSAPQLARRMQEWYKNASSSRDVEAGEIGQWEQNLLTLAAAGNYEEEFPVLARSSPTWELLRKRHEANTAIEAADQYFRNRFGDGAEVPADLDGRISNLLMHLAEDPDAEEDQILRKIRRAEAVIDTRDDAVAQRRVAADEADRSRALNILSLVTRAAFPGGRRQAPTMTSCWRSC
jgi:hypothetical protein